MTQTLDFVADLKQIPDYRKGKGKRHALWLVLIANPLGNLVRLQRLSSFGRF